MNAPPVRPQKWAELEKRLEALGISRSDIDEKHITGGGKGGQKVNRTHNCVVLTHRPSGASARSQHSRSLELNRYTALKLLADAVEMARTGHVRARDEKAEKIRRQKKRRKRRSNSELSAPASKSSKGYADENDPIISGEDNDV